MSGLGGYGTILIYDINKKQIRYLNTSGRFPLKCNSDLMRKPTTDYLGNRTGPKAISTPGNLNAWKELHKTYGKMPWSDLFEGAIACAEKGFRITPHCAKWIEASFASFSDYSRSFYGMDGLPLKEGDVLVQNDLAGTYKLIAKKGPDPFYHGEIAARVHKQMEEIGSFLSIEDFIGFIDYLAGYAIFFSAFYLIPVALAAWYVGRAFAMLISVSSVTVSIVGDYAAGAAYPNLLIPLWNGLIALTVYFVVVKILTSLRKLQGNWKPACASEPPR